MKTKGGLHLHIYISVCTTEQSRYFNLQLRKVIFKESILENRDFVKGSERIGKGRSFETLLTDNCWDEYFPTLARGTRMEGIASSIGVLF